MAPVGLSPLHCHRSDAFPSCTDAGGRRRETPSWVQRGMSGRLDSLVWPSVHLFDMHFSFRPLALADPTSCSLGSATRYGSLQTDRQSAPTITPPCRPSAAETPALVCAPRQRAGTKSPAKIFRGTLMDASKVLPGSYRHTRLRRGLRNWQKRVEARKLHQVPSCFCRVEIVMASIGSLASILLSLVDSAVTGSSFPSCTWGLARG